MITREDVERIASIRDMKSTLQNWLECPRNRTDCPFKIRIGNNRRIQKYCVGVCYVLFPKCKNSKERCWGGGYTSCPCDCYPREEVEIIAKKLISVIKEKEKLISTGEFHNCAARRKNGV